MKSKQQKQQEAIERKRKFLPTIRAEWLKAHKDLTLEARARANNGDVEALKLIEVAVIKLKKFEKAAREAHCDMHGNPLQHNPNNHILGWDTNSNFGKNYDPLKNLQTLNPAVMDIFDDE